MGKNSIFLWRFMAAFTVFFCHTFDVDAKIDTPKPRLKGITVCNAGEYISKCGDYYVGTNWLKGYTETSINVINDGTNSTEQVYTKKTPDYFDYSDNADEVNMENLRKFFTFKDTLQTIYYTPNTSSQEYQVENSVVPSEYEDNRNKILIKFCDPRKVVVTCAPCPGNGTTEESTYSAGGRLSSWSWDSFNTIAHCYMTKFNDMTGTYINIDQNSISSSETPEECYFVNGANYVGGSVLNLSTGND